MSELPTGTVTFLFSDIEGSTRLLQLLGERFSALLEGHRSVIRSAVAECAGVEIGTEGDSFFVVFRTPADALRAAVSMQRRLAAHDWPDGAAVRVRIGVHTGEGVLGPGGYFGIDVNRAARISDAAHGGQIIVSESTHALCEHSLPEGTAFEDLGRHRLKDILHLEHLYGLVIEGLPCDFPPPRTLDVRPNNLPLQLTSFIGRDKEIAAVKGVLEGTRLLTLSGPGGTGKTRLALQSPPRSLPSTEMGPSLSISPRLRTRPSSPPQSPPLSASRRWPDVPSSRTSRNISAPRRCC